MLRRDYGMQADHFDFGCDLETYALDRSPGADGTADGHLLLLPPVDAAPRARARHGDARPLRRPPPRGGHPLLRRAGRDGCPSARPTTASSTRKQLNALYNRCIAGLALSATNVSLVPHEMLACGCIPVVNDAEHTRIVLDNDHVATRRRRRSSWPTRSTRSSRTGSAERVEAAAGSVSGTSWDDAGAKFEAIVRRRWRRAAPRRSRREPADVSVIVPCYGYADVLEGLRAQRPRTGGRRRPGADRRRLLARRHAGGRRRGWPAADPRVEYRRNAQNLGLIATANAGLAWADGDYVVLLSADDLLVPGALPRATTIMEANPNVGMVYGHAPYWHVGGPPLRTQGALEGRRRSGAAPTGCACAAGRATTASPRPRSSCAPRCSARSAATTPLHALQRPQHVAAHRGRRPTSPASAASRRPSTGSTPRACCAARTRRSSTCASAARPSTRSSPRARSGSRTPTRCARWPAARWPARPCGAPAAPTTAASRRARTRSPVDELRLRARRLPRRAAAARVARPAGAPAHRRRALDALPPLRGHRRRPPGARPRQPAALARPRR